MCVCLPCLAVLPLATFTLALRKLRRRRWKKTTEVKTKTERKELHPLTVDPLADFLAASPWLSAPGLPIFSAHIGDSLLMSKASAA